MSYPAYDSYRDSGIAWLGDIPEGWDIRRLRFMVQTNPPLSSFGFDPSQAVSFISMDAVGEYGELDLSHKRHISELNGGYTPFADGDVIVAKITPCFENVKGALAQKLKNGLALGTTELHVLRAKSGIHPNYLFYLSISQYFRKLGEGSMYGAGGQKRISDEFVKNFKIAVPPLEEQKAIAGFLDEKTAQIDALIARKEKLLELLAEKQSALITHAVTKGLDPTAPMKPSGIAWLGDIPEGWDIRRLRSSTNIHSSNVDKKTIEGELIVKLCNYTDVYYNYRITRELEFMRATASPSEKEKFALNIGDVVITKDSETPEDIGVPALIDENIDDLVCGYHLAIIKGNPDTVFGPFLFYLINSDISSSQFEVMAHGVTRYGLSYEAIKNVLATIPPLEKQKAIAGFLDEKTAQIDALHKKMTEAVEYLKEYRSALITNAVTGKIKVI